MPSRAVKETDIRQGAGESIIYTITTTPWGSSPTDVTVAGYEVKPDDTFTDVTTTIIPSGSASVSGDVITLPAVTALTAEKRYRIEVLFTSGSNTFEAYFEIKAER